MIWKIFKERVFLIDLLSIYTRICVFDILQKYFKAVGKFYISNLTSNLLEVQLYDRNGNTAPANLSKIFLNFLFNVLEYQRSL